MSREYLVALPIDPMPYGTPYFERPLPMHCTLMHWFELNHDKGLVGLEDKLFMLASGVKRGDIELAADGTDQFGENNDVPVFLMKRNKRLNLLHTEILLFLGNTFCRPKKTEWVGAGYRPHVANVAGCEFGISGYFVPNSLVLVGRGDDKVMRVIGTCPFVI